jgi:hypothetical protein
MSLSHVLSADDQRRHLMDHRLTRV